MSERMRHDAITCPTCEVSAVSSVIDSRPARGKRFRVMGGAIRRRRKCLACGYRFSTYEIHETQIETARYRQLVQDIQSAVKRAARLT